MMSDFASELAKYPKSSPNSKIPPKWDVKNDARYARNFIIIYRKSGSPSTDMTSDFALEVAM